MYAGGVIGLTNLVLNLGPCVLGLLGPNGAGKSTLMNILATVAKPTSGAITFNGVDIHRAPDSLRSVLGYLPQDFGVYPNLTAEEFLAYVAALKGVNRQVARRRIEELLRDLNLTGARRRPLGSFSGGMRQRVGIAQALINDPQILIVDEPTVGLDPEERIRFRTLLTQLAGDRIVILSTHIVSDVEAVATKIAVMRKGELVVQGEPDELLRSVSGRVWEFSAAAEEMERIRQRGVVVSAIRRKDGVWLRVVAETRPVGEAQPVPPTMEDAYLHWVHAGEAAT